MSQDTEIRTALERVVKAVSIRASVGQGTAVTRVQLGAGLTAQVEEGPWSFAVGMSEKYGGAGDAPNPGVYGRGALGACLAIGYRMWSARMGVPIDSLIIEVHATYDVRGELGVRDDVPPGYTHIRYVVHIRSSASETEVMRLLDTADRYSSWRDDLARSVPMEREVRVESALPARG